MKLLRPHFIIGFAGLALSQFSGFATAQIKPALQATLTRAQLESVADCSIRTEGYRPVDRTSVFVRPGRTVTIGMQADEAISTTIWEQSQPNELIQEFVHPDQRNLTVKLRVPSPVPGVITTTKRRYFVVLVPSEGAGSPCYQGLIFAGSATDGSNGGFNPFGSTVAAPLATGVDAPSVSEAAPGSSVDPAAYAGSPNFEYSIAPNAQGEGIKPISVYDNGKFTWVHFPSSVQVLPALFYTGPNGMELVNVIPTNKGQALLVNRTMEAFILKLGNAEVVIKANRR